MHIIYARQSLDRDGEGAAVERQVSACQQLAAARGITVDRVLSDNSIGASNGKHRPAYAELLLLLRSGRIKTLFVYHLDRLTRRLADVVELVDLCERTDTRIVTVTGDLDLSTDTGRMVAGILGSVAEVEVRRKGARQRAANAQRAAAGRMGWTRRPFAYDRDDGSIVVVPHERDALLEAAEVVLAGGTLAAAVRRLDSAGLTTTAGKPWNVTSLRRALLNPRYSGRVTYNGTDVATGTWPVILDVEKQQRLAEVLRDVRRRVQQGTTPLHLLSGIAVCGRCGERLFGSPMVNRGRRWHVYKCGSCYLARRSDLVDEVVEGAVLARLARHDAAALLAPQADLDALRGEATELRDRRDSLAALLADGLMSATAVREQAGALTAKLEAVESAIATAVGESPLATIVGAEDVQAAWDRLDLRTRKAVVGLLMAVRVLPVGKGVRFDPTSVEVAWRTS